MTTVIISDSIYVHYSLLGCYGDGSNRVMDYNFGTVSSIEACFNIAVNNNYNYFGIQSGNQCWLSNNVSKATQLGLCGQCVNNGCTNPTCDCSSMKCSNGDNCGDNRASALYQITSGKSPTITPTAKLPLQPSSTNTPTQKLAFQPSGKPIIITKPPSNIPMTASNPTLVPIITPVSKIPSKKPTKQPTSSLSSLTSKPSVISKTSVTFIPSSMDESSTNNDPTYSPSANTGGTGTANTNSKGTSMSSLNSITFYSIIITIVVIIIIAVFVYLIYQNKKKRHSERRVAEVDISGDFDDENLNENDYFSPTSKNQRNNAIEVKGKGSRKGGIGMMSDVYTNTTGASRNPLDVEYSLQGGTRSQLRKFSNATLRKKGLGAQNYTGNDQNDSDQSSNNDDDDYNNIIASNVMLKSTKMKTSSKYDSSGNPI